MSRTFPRVSDPPGTLLEVLVKLLSRVERFNEQEQAPPAALLWPDPEADFLPALPLLRAMGLPVFLLGEHDPAQGRGPAIWLRCVVDRTLEMGLREGAIPILHLPGVGRSDLAAGDAMRKDLRPLASLAHEGAVFFQKNGREWTLEALLRTEAADLDPARDATTREAMRAVSRELMQTPLRALRDRERLEAEDFYRILADDLPRDMLHWIRDPKGMREERTAEAWQAFAARCRANLEFDPEKESVDSAALKLGLRQDGWSEVWDRFVQAPGLYPAVARRLHSARPDGGLFQHPDAWPQDNEERETDLRQALGALPTGSPDALRTGLQRLEAEHGMRRSWVWARLGQAPLAQALSPLMALAEATSKPLAGTTRQELLAYYAAGGYKADVALLQALQGSLAGPARPVVEQVARALYLPWADAAARALQDTRLEECPPAYEAAAAGDEEGTCWVFVDGLRYDIAKYLASELEGEGLQVSLDWRMAALPTVTATAKPAAMPLAFRLRGVPDGKGFATRQADTSTEMNAERLRDLLTQAGYRVLSEGETGDPAAGGRAWTETGSFDAKGHSLQRDLVEVLANETVRLKERLKALLDAGWKRLRVVTDHGWLYLPGGLPKEELPRYLVESRWSRCAELPPGGKADVPVAPWSWDPLVHVAYAPGIACFRVGHCYAHGGISPQECVVPDMVLRRVSTPRKAVGITELRWARLRLVVQCEGSLPGLQVQLRLEAKKRETEVTPQVALSPEGRAVLLVEDDDLDGKPVSCVVLDAEGRVLAQRATTVGGE